ncbi:unnamed protein product [Rotaria socialis]
MSALPAKSVTKIVVGDQNDTTMNTKTSKSKCQWLRTYFSKWTGQHTALPPSATFFDCVVGFVSAFVSITILAVVHYRLLTSHDLVLFIASFGATAVLVYGLPLSPLAQPRSVVGGQVISAIIGCAVRVLFGTNGVTFVAAALAVSLTLFVMQMTSTVHAPAGATALIVVISNTSFPWSGFQYVLMPVLSGSLILVFLAVVINNLVPTRHYPCHWW